MNTLKNSITMLCIVFAASIVEQCRSKSFDYGYGENDAPVVVVGSQQWMAKNLNVDHFANGDPIPQAQTAAEWEKASNEKRPAWCYYNSDSAKGSTYGKLYNWYCVNDPRGLAPKGWHVPNDTEWTTLIDFLGGEKQAGVKMKSLSHWDDNGNGDNSSGFAGVPGGFRYSDGTFEAISQVGTWWSSSEEASNRTLYFNGNEVVRYTYPKTSGFSVRCIKD